MPLYEYRCQQCGSVFEVIQKFSDLPLENCAKCGGSLEKLLSSPAIQFKGAGWYITDYSRKGDTAPAKPNAESKSTDSASETAGKEVPSKESRSSSDTSPSDTGKSETPTKAASG